MDKQTIALWYALPEDFSKHEDIEACAELLSEDELARSRSFRFEMHRREYVTAHFLLRTALSYTHPLAPDAWRFRYNSYGKPRLDPADGLQFNLSHSPGLAVCLIGSGGEVGIDSEPYERAEQIIEVAPRMFSPLERAQLDELHGHVKRDRALSLWTLKEAYVKARGMGLSLPLRTFSFRFDGGEDIRLEMDPEVDDVADRWRFCLLDIAGHRCALVVERETNRDLQLWEIEPSLPAARLEGCDVRWFPG